jgi:gamma-glutamylcyclotransferase (GGCT)/AIG2-like uncharacterized protein YtfP
VAAAPAHIFVYGTLRADHDHHMARRLLAQARLVGRGRAPGLLYDCGWYPAALFDKCEKQQVIGDVFALAPGARLLAELDAYEAGDPNYARAPLDVTLDSGGTIVAWAYGVIKAPNAKLIPVGDFIAHWNAKNPRPARR